MRSPFLLALAAVCGVFASAPLAAQSPRDTVTVGTVSAHGPVVVVPVYVRDVAGTPLGIDQPFGSRIQALSIKVDYTPSPFLQSVTFTRAGITAPLTPSFETSPSTTGSISLLLAFDEATALLPFDPTLPAPGILVGQLTFTFAPSTPSGTTIPLALDASLTELSNEGGTTTESVGNAQLALVSGAVTVLAAASAAVPTLDVWGLALLGTALAILAMRARA